MLNLWFLLLLRLVMPTGARGGSNSRKAFAAEEEDEREILIWNTLCCKQYSKKPINKYSQIRNSIGYNFSIGEHIYIRRYVLYRLIPEHAGIEGCLPGRNSSEISLQGFFPAWYLIISSTRTTFTGTIILILLLGTYSGLPMNTQQIASKVLWFCSRPVQEPDYVILAEYNSILIPLAPSTYY